MEVTSISSYEEFLSLEECWKYIFEKSGTTNIFISWEWCLLWWKHYSNNHTMLILLVKDRDEVIGIAPLMIMDGNYLTLWKPVIRFLGDDMMADYMDLLILRDNKEVVKTIINFLTKQSDFGRIDLMRIPEHSHNFIAIKDSLAEISYPSIMQINCISPSVKIEGAWDNYYDLLSKKLKKDLKFTLNRLKSLGDLSFEISCENTIKTSLDALFAMHGKRQVNKTGKSLFENPIDRNFFYDVAFTFNKTNWVDISVLKINNRIISVVLALKFKGTFYYWIPAFDPEFIKYSIGKVHIHTLLKKCFEQNYKEFDFMIGDEEYKFKWANGAFKNYQIKIYKNRLFYKLDILKSALRNYLRDTRDKSALLENVWKKISKSEILSNRL